MYLDGVVTAVSLTLGKSYIGQMLSIESEISPVTSERVSVTVTGQAQSTTSCILSCDLLMIVICK